MTQTWRQAHEIANIATAQAHSDLSVSRNTYVDVFSAIRSAGLPMLLQWMPKLFGIFLCAASNGPGILLNSGLPLATLRHTAAHELGHHWLGHGDALDQDLDCWSGQAPVGWTGQEMEAEAFAVWFVMPRPAVMAALRRLGLQRPRSAEDVYRIATMLGVSYRGLARHLVNLRLADWASSQAWARTAPARIRSRLLGAASAGAGRGEIHLLAPEMGDLTIYAGTGDLLVLYHDGVLAPGIADGLQSVESPLPGPPPTPSVGARTPQMFRVTADRTAPVTLRIDGASAQQAEWTVSVNPVQVREGIDLTWLEAQQDHEADD